jgi:hypothetical protein
VNVRKLALGYCTFTGAAITLLWVVLLLTGNAAGLVSQPVKVSIHLISGVTSGLLLLLTAVTLAKRKKWACRLYFFSLGMLLYSVLNAVVYYVQIEKWDRVLVFSILVIVTVVFAFLGKEERLKAETEELIRLEYRIADALIRNDYRFLDRVYDKDYICTTVTGNRTDKRSAMKEILSPEVIIKLYDNKVSEVRFFGTSALIIGEANVKGHFANKNSSGVYRYTHLFIKQGEEWKLSVAHISKFEN